MRKANQSRTLAAGIPRRRSAAHAAITVCATSLLVFSAASAQRVDTSDWTCEFCPFEEGYRADVSVGAANVSDDSAYFGDASGYDEEGVYLNLDGQGWYASDRHRARWNVENLGLDTRAIGLEGGMPGTFDYLLTYRELPRRQFDTTVTAFRDVNGVLTLPSGWTRSPTTGGLSALGSSLARQDIASDRNTFAIGGRYLPATRWSVSADYRRQQQDGVKIIGGSYYTSAALLPAPIDYVTDEVDLGIRYAGSRWAVALGWYLSEFDNGQQSFAWQHPFTTVPGAEFAALAQPPGNRFQQLSLSGSYALPLYSTFLSFSAAVGEIEQDEAFLPYTTNLNLATAALPRSNFAGSVDTTRLAFSASAKPIARSRVKLSYRYDERDSGTPRDTWNRVLTDTFISGELELNTPYSYQRTALTLSGDYDVMNTLRASAGYDRRQTDRDFQEVAEQTEDDSWGRLRWRPRETLELTLKGGRAKRDIDRYNEVLAVSFGQNPLLRKYNLAYRYREYGELGLNYAPTALPIAITVTGYRADDSYTKSQLGMTRADETRFATDLSWTVSERTTAYLSGGIENIESQQAGGQLPNGLDWGAGFNDDFMTLGAGLRIRNIRDKFDLQADYTQSRGESEINVNSAFAGSSAFPKLETNLDFLRVALNYRRSEKLTIDLNLRYQRFRAEDWALEGVGPATIPAVLTLGALPYSPEVYVVGAGFRYRIGKP
ncbi:MAG: MtrB/PioB family decaheme-associated outer membrane protein [Woeseia sp.]